MVPVVIVVDHHRHRHPVRLLRRHRRRRHNDLQVEERSTLINNINIIINEGEEVQGVIIPVVVVTFVRMVYHRLQKKLRHPLLHLQEVLRG